MSRKIPPAEIAPSEKSAQRFFGLLARRERWGLSGRGWLLLALATAIGGGLAAKNVQPFLAPTERQPAKILVVEGWIADYAIRAAVKEFQDGGYEKVYVTGGPVVGLGRYVNDFQTSASVGAELLVKAGVPSAVVQMTPSHESGHDRTYSSAVALREWWRAHGVVATNFNVLTEDVHARRTQLLFQKAFGDGARAGVVAVRDPDYDPAHWWHYSEGVRQILAESVAYLYAKFIFKPD
jgi:hypothetical protein